MVWAFNHDAGSLPWASLTVLYPNKVLCYYSRAPKAPAATMVSTSDASSSSCFFPYLLLCPHAVSVFPDLSLMSILTEQRPGICQENLTFLIYHMLDPISLFEVPGHCERHFLVPRCDCFLFYFVFFLFCTYLFELK